MLRRFSFVLASALVACSPAAPRPSGSAEWTASGDSPTFSPRAAYETAPTSGGTRGLPSAARLRDEIRARLPGRTLDEDGRLAELAERVLYQTRDSGRGPSAVELDALVRKMGLVVAMPMVGVFPVNGGTFSGLDDYLAGVPKNLSFSHLGVTVVDLGGQLAGAAALAGEHVALEPVPRRIEPGQTVALRGTVAADYHDVELAWTEPGGKTERRKLGTGSRVAETSAPLAAGIHRVELLAVGPSGLEVIANFPVAVGVSPDVDRPAPLAVDETDPKAALLSLTNETRREAGVSLLAPDPILDRVAEAHSADMAEHGFFGHQSPTTGMVDDRARAAGLRLGLLGENVAKAPSIAEAHALLLASPGHRDNIVNPRFSHVGLGVVLEHASAPTVWAVTEVFAGIPRPLSDPARAADAAFAAVAKARSAASVPALARSSSLDDLARRMATRVVQEPKTDLGTIATESAKPWVAKTRVGIPLILITFFADPEDLATDVRAEDPKLRHAGVAVAQSADADALRTSVEVLLATE
ncbi:MAG TPA: CAP domain-containing protein [Polyangiaceae bacterium]|nr:CAP domain-containing protein [Polyangiaceae bacterium]